MTRPPGWPRRFRPTRHDRYVRAGRAPAEDDRDASVAGPWFRRSARLRIVVVQLAVVALALLFAVLVTREFLLSRMDSRIDRSLVQEVEELRTLAAQGVDPVTRDPFNDAGRLMRVHLQRSVPEANETMLSVVDGVADARIAQPPPLRLDLDPAHVARFAASTSTALRDLETTLGTVRYIAAPVQVTGSDTRGVFVVAAFRDVERQEIDDVTLVLAGAGGLGLLLAALAAWIVAGRVLAPVRDVRRTAETIGAGDLTRRIEVQGTDEVAQLSGTFNQMLDRLEDAFSTQQQFVDDAGHELRTPLTIIRGNLETMGSDPESQRQALDVVMHELDRMARMVDDLLTLAKARRPDFLILRPVELSELTAGLMQRCGAIGDRDWRLDGSGAGWFDADGQRLTQAMLQLAQNAVQHTDDGDTIRIGSRIDTDTVELWVHDTGPGVAPADRSRIFERFRRAGDSRRNDDGAGLGLAIVGSIARAHGGDVHLDDTPVGARFSLRLPRSGVER